MRSRVFGRSLFVCTIALTLATSTATSSTGRCENLKRWASQYAGSSPSLEDLAKFDRPQRMAIFNAVSPDVRAELWQEHLRRFSRRTDLSDTQRSLIANAGPLMTAALYRKEPAATRAFEALTSRIESAFQERALRHAAWFDLGSTVRSSPRTRRADETFCNCRVGFGECGMGSVCGGGTCTTWLGCGYTMQEWCNGLCQ